ncbi:hypothetical protein [Anaerosinus massiliensis]|uniref:hypothetical protein n=1 Tax=Massilibacillus massiliensis TaxID=1806837 RepID=UPI000DA5F64E|nr:hypothetical protein [Massilibacillus massiliensis]
MKNYRIDLSAIGRMTQIPDSQRVFGVLVSLFAERYGDQQATSLVTDVLHKNIHFALSNLMPLGYLPTPVNYLVDCLVERDKQASGNVYVKMEQSKVEATLKQLRNEIRNRNYIGWSDIEKSLNDPMYCTTLFPYVKVQSGQQSRTSLESARLDLPGIENKLFSVPTIEVTEVSGSQDKQIQQPVGEFCFYLQLDKENALCEKFLMMLRTVMEENQPVILGKRASQGLNVFTFRKFDEISFKSQASSDFINLGMLLPNQINFAASTLKLFTSERRPFHMLGGWDNNLTKQYISFIAEGSMINVEDEKKAVKSILSPFNPERDIVFGNAFLYPITLQKGERSNGRNQKNQV